MKPISKEADLFDFLKRSTYPDLVKAKNQMSRWDCYSPKVRHRIELKCRKKHYDTLLIERKKFQAINSVCETNLDIPIYVCSTPGGVFLFNLFWVSPNWEINRRNPATTEFGNRARVEKEVAYLNIKESRLL
jgi:hypothetical protein|tara:strand:+ start:3608 stop:4003 length:396 start_codon:yes stop_codon:yes gene_type:complete